MYVYTMTAYSLTLFNLLFTIVLTSTREGKVLCWLMILRLILVALLPFLRVACLHVSAFELALYFP